MFYKDHYQGKTWPFAFVEDSRSPCMKLLSMYSRALKMGGKIVKFFVNSNFTKFS